MSIPPPGPLAYEGQVVVPFIVRDFPPTTAFNQFSVPTIWIEPTAENAYILTGKPLGVANWLLFVNGGGNVGTLKGNTGGSVSPTVAGLINVVGDGTTITIAGNPGTNTLTASLVGGQEAIDSFQPDSGTNPVVPNAAGLVTMSGSGSITTVGGTNTLTTQLTGLTNHAVLVGAGTTTITKVGPSATTGAPLISGGAAADPGFSTTFTISDSGLIASETASLVGGVVQLGVRNTDNTNASSGARLNVTAGGSSAGDVYTLYDCNVAGKNYEVGCQQSSSNFLINYAANTGTALLSGTNIFYHDPTPSAVAQPATPSTFLQNTNYLALNQTAAGQRVRIECIQNDSANTASAAGIGSRVAGAIGSVNGDAFMYCVGNLDWTWGEDASVPGTPIFRFGHGGSPRSLAEQFYSISNAGVITFGKTTAGNFYSFPTADGTAGQVLTTNGAGTVTWSSSGAGGWSVIGASQTLAVNNGYFCTTGGALSLALPAVSAVGDEIDVVLDGSTSWTITQPNAATRIRIGNQQTTLGVGGSLASTLAGDSVKLVCETANARWAVISMIGNITVV